MASTTMQVPPGVDPGLLDNEAYEIVRRSLTRQDALDRAARWSELLKQHPPPAGANACTRKVWAALLDAAGPLTSQELAVMFNRHRGNIDRALTPLREAGLITTSHGLHQPRPENCRRG